MSTERTFLTDGSYAVAQEESRSWVQLFASDQSAGAGVWSINYTQDISTFRSVVFPLTTSTHSNHSRTLQNPHSGALETAYLVGETINSIEQAQYVKFTRIYAFQIADVVTVSGRDISLPDWNGLNESGSYAATIDNRRTAIYTARKPVEAISELQEIETITTADLKATIHGIININGATSDLTQSVDDIWEDLFLVTGIRSVLKSSTKIRLYISHRDLRQYDISITGLQSGTGYLVSQQVLIWGSTSYIEIEFIYTRSIVSGLLTLQSRDPKIIYTSDFSAGVDGWTSWTEDTTFAGNIDGIGGQNDCLRITVNGNEFGQAGTIMAYPATPTAPESGVYFVKCDVYVPSSVGNNTRVWLGHSQVINSYDPGMTDTWITLTSMHTGEFDQYVKALRCETRIGYSIYVKNFTLETINRTIDLSGSIDDLYSDLNLGGAITSIVKDSENVTILFNNHIDTDWISASISNGTSYVSHEIMQNGAEFKITFRDERRASEVTTNAQSQRTLTVTSHGLIQGDVVALFAGDALVGVTTCTQVIDTSNFTVPANALPGADDIVTHIGDASASSIYSSYPQSVLVTTTRKIYIPGVTSGIDSLSDIPIRQGLDTPQSWLIAITDGLITAQIDGTLIEHPYPGLYIASENEFLMSDVLNQTDHFLTDTNETFIIADW